MVNVLFVGGVSGVARSFIPPLLDSPTVNLTVLSRLESKTPLTFLPSSVKALTADLTSLPALVSAFTGIDVVISTIAGAALSQEPLYITAAITAGVKRFIPSGYGVDPSHPFLQSYKDHPLFKEKVSTHALLKELGNEGKITYTTIVPAAFADWGFEYAFWGIDIPNRKAILIDGGDVPYSSTNLITVGRTLAWIVNNLEASKNREIYIQDIEASQNELLAETEKQLGGEPFAREYYTGEEAFKKGVELAMKGNGALGTMFVYLATACGSDGAGKNKGNNSEEVGYETKGVAEIVSDAIRFWEDRKKQG